MVVSRTDWGLWHSIEEEEMIFFYLRFVKIVVVRVSKWSNSIFM
jgi:hypothetical protein